MPDYLLATLRQMARSLRHQLSTATVSDRAGERLTDDIMHEGEGRQNGASSSGEETDGSGVRVAAEAVAAPAQQPLRRAPSGGGRGLDAV
jgi:hypothetical protein